MNITIHAKERLKERYNITDEKQLHKIKCYFYNPVKYKIVNFNKEGEVREINVENKIIQGVVVGKVLVTIIPPTFILNDDYEKITKGINHYAEMEGMIYQLRDYYSQPLLKSLKRFFSERKYYRQKKHSFKSKIIKNWYK